MDGFQQFSRKEIIEAKYADDLDIKETLLEFESHIEDHNRTKEQRTNEYRGRLNGIYTPIINK